MMIQWDLSYVKGAFEHLPIASGLFEGVVNRHTEAKGQTNTRLQWGSRNVRYDK